MNGRFDSLRNAINDDAPSGNDLEYDPLFARMEKASQGTPDQEYGATKIEAQPPDWAEVSRLALELLERTRDLRVATYLAQAELVESKLPGLRDSLELIADWVENLWDTVYPQLDPDDDNDPTIRVNALMGLSNSNMLIKLRQTTILRARGVGAFSWTDVSIARGELPIPDGMEEPPTLKKVEAAVSACEVQELQAYHQAVVQSLAAIERIEQAFSDRVGSVAGPNLEALSKELRGISKIQKLWLDRRLPAGAPEKLDREDSDDNKGMIALETTSRSRAQVIDPQVVGAASFIITRREDAIEGLDMIISWFEQYEPSSPLPMLLKRAKRLSTMSFMDILRDISPSGIEQAMLLGGQAAEEEEVEDEPPSLSQPKAKVTPPAVKETFQPIDENY
ncbi:MAG: type VI secretion system protein TssA [Pirellulaceae bacterium]|nr:type VI secretion system protein TssA [Pirellulaceae bacterium]